MTTLFARIIAPVLLFTSLQLHAANPLTLGEGINLIAINGKELKNGSLLQGTAPVKLTNGKNQLLLSYTAEIKNGNDYELEQTPPAIVSFTSTNQSITIRAPQIKTDRELKGFIEEQNWLITANKTPLDFQAELLPLKGFRIGVNYERELADFNQQQGTHIVAPNTSALDLSGNSEQLLILQMLNHWYQLASPETKQRFLEAVR